MTRKPGNLLPFIVTRKRVGRGAPVSLNELLHPARGRGGCGDNRGDVSAIALGRQSCQFYRAVGVLRPISRAVLSRLPPTKFRPSVCCAVPSHRWFCLHAFRLVEHGRCGLKPRRRWRNFRGNWCRSSSPSRIASQSSGCNRRQGVRQHRAGLRTAASVGLRCQCLRFQIRRPRNLR